MKILIDIKDDEYEKIMNGYMPLYEAANLIRNIQKGTTLPKGHGDLIDRTALMNRPYETGGFVEWYDEIKYAPTIIEADKEDEE